MPGIVFTTRLFLYRAFTSNQSTVALDKSVTTTLLLLVLTMLLLVLYLVKTKRNSKLVRVKQYDLPIYLTKDSNEQKKS